MPCGFRPCFKKSSTSVVLCGIAAACGICYRDHVLDAAVEQRRGESAGGRGRKPVAKGATRGERGCDARLYGVSSNRRVSAACFNLTSLSASVPSGVARTLLVSSRTRQSPGFNIKPPRSFSLAWAFFLFSLSLLHAGYPFEDPDDGFSTRANWWRVDHYRPVNRSA